MIALLIEMTGDKVPDVSMELMELALRLKSGKPSDILALVHGKQSEKGAPWFAEESGAETLGLMGTEEGHSAMEMAEAFKGLLKTRGVRYLLFAHTPRSMDMAPALAIALGLPLVSGVVAFDRNSGTFYRAAGGGKLRLHVEAPMGAVVTLQPGTLPSAPRAVTPGSLTLKRIAVSKGPTQILSTHARNESASNLSGARVVVSVGRGLESRENLPLFNHFAEALPEAAKACSRPLVDMGWMPYPCQVGITGTSVSAELYIALGISGSTQHLASISQKTTVVSVNRDPNAAIHSISDLIIETDLLPFMKATLEMLSAPSLQNKKGANPAG
ncbi:electron transfer flavoprotein subunit alpha/FixB family protein [Desulfoluna sp.]|uniref:electron transfer flavoprotein subunit alpha/FixB family protein n=1 Tax=Desulfoluna sp. TaxID=2045199 RepID=UPI0026051D4A|nr:electron transfer flavoprotein subunit alpha/FixB family protein [Desulfoluna sp.]